MGRGRVIVAILAVGVMNHGPSTVERPNREFGSWDFRGRPNKSSSPLLRNQILTWSTPHSLLRSIWPAAASCSLIP